MILLENFGPTFPSHYCDKHPTLDEKREFWNSVAFYNFVQEFVGAEPRMCPTGGMFDSSAPAFFEVLETLRPEFIVVCGYKLWENLPTSSIEDTVLKTASGEIKIAQYNYSDSQCLACGIKHPSAGFNGKEWHPLVMAALSQPLR